MSWPARQSSAVNAVALISVSLAAQDPTMDPDTDDDDIHAGLVESTSDVPQAPSLIPLGNRSAAGHRMRLVSFVRNRLFQKCLGQFTIIVFGLAHNGSYPTSLFNDCDTCVPVLVLFRNSIMKLNTIPRSLTSLDRNRLGANRCLSRFPICGCLPIESIMKA